MLTKVISWMKSSIANPMPRGVPVSLVQPWSWSLYYIRFRYPNKFIEPHLDARWDVSLRIPYPLPTVLLHLYHICESVVCHHFLVSLIAFMYNYWHVCNKLLSIVPCNIFMLLAYCIKSLSASGEVFISNWILKIGFSINIFIGKPVVASLVPEPG